MAKPRDPHAWFYEHMDGENPRPRKGEVLWGHRVLHDQLSWAEVRKHYQWAHDQLSPAVVHEGFLGRMRWLKHFSYRAPEQSAARRPMLSYGRK